MRVELFRAGGLQPWRFRLIGSNGEIVSQSEGYVTKWSCKRTARSIADRLGVPLIEDKPYRRFP